jgi:hypothetical protein
MDQAARPVFIAPCHPPRALDRPRGRHNRSRPRHLSLGAFRRAGRSTTHRDMTKRHILYWMFNFLGREHPDFLNDMKQRIAGDDEDQSVREAWRSTLPRMKR